MSERAILESSEVTQLSEVAGSIAALPEDVVAAGVVDPYPFVTDGLAAEQVPAQAEHEDEGAAFRRAMQPERRQRSRSRGRRLASGLLAFSLATGTIVATEIADAPIANADTLNYPYVNIPCVWSPYAVSGPANTNWCKKVDANGKIVSDYDWGTIRDDNGNDSELSPYGYDYRNCTDFVAWKVASLGVQAAQYKGLGNANQWPTYAPGHNLTVNSAPTAGAAAVDMAGTYGHVAFVDSVNSDGTITVEEYNHGQDGVGGTRTGTPSSLGLTEFVHFEQYETSAPTSGGGGSSSSQGAGVGTAAYKGSDHLVVNQPLYQGQYIESPDGMFVLELQGDGNLVEYGPGFQPVWASNTGGANIGYVVMQPDGNLVGYTPDGRTALWSNGEANSGSNNTLYMQPDGNLVEYTSSGNAVWSDGKNRPGYYPPAYKGGNELVTNEGLYQNQYIRSNNGQHFVLLQTDGSAVVYGPGDHVVGGFGPPTSGAGYVVLQPDGNFVEYQPNGQTSIWGNGEVNSGGNYMTIQDDGNFVEYQSNGTTAVWGTGTNGKI